MARSYIPEAETWKSELQQILTLPENTPAEQSYKLESMNEFHKRYGKLGEPLPDTLQRLSSETRTAKAAPPIAGLRDVPQIGEQIQPGETPKSLWDRAQGVFSEIDPETSLQTRFGDQRLPPLPGRQGGLIPSPTGGVNPPISQGGLIPPNAPPYTPYQAPPAPGATGTDVMAPDLAQQSGLDTLSPSAFDKARSAIEGLKFPEDSYGDIPEWAIPLMVAGFSIAASPSPYFGVAAGQGGMAGIKAFASQRGGRAERAQEKAAFELEKATSIADISAQEAQAAAMRGQAKVSDITARRLEEEEISTDFRTIKNLADVYQEEEGMGKVPAYERALKRLKGNELIRLMIAIFSNPLLTAQMDQEEIDALLQAAMRAMPDATVGEAATPGARKPGKADFENRVYTP